MHVVVAGASGLIGSALVDALRARGDEVTVHHADCGHMVPFLEPGLAAALVRSLL